MRWNGGGDDSVACHRFETCEASRKRPNERNIKHIGSEFGTGPSSADCPAPITRTIAACSARRWQAVSATVGGLSDHGRCRRETANTAAEQRSKKAQGGAAMLDLYTWPTPNGHKVHIMLEELGVDYKVIPIDIWAGEQFSADFLRISPEQQDAGAGRSRRPGRRPDLDIRVRGDPALPRREASPVPAVRCAWAMGSHAMADVPDERSRAIPWSGPPFPRVRAGEDRVRNRPLHERGGPHLPRARWTTRGSGVPRGRVLDRRHRHVSVVAPARAPGAGPRRPSRMSSGGSARSNAALPSSVAFRCSRTGATPVP